MGGCRGVKPYALVLWDYSFASSTHNPPPAFSREYNIGSVRWQAISPYGISLREHYSYLFLKYEGIVDLGTDYCHARVLLALLRSLTHKMLD